MLDSNIGKKNIWVRFGRPIKKMTLLSNRVKYTKLNYIKELYFLLSFILLKIKNICA